MASQQTVQTMLTAHFQKSTSTVTSKATPGTAVLSKKTPPPMSLQPKPASPTMTTTITKPTTPINDNYDDNITQNLKKINPKTNRSKSSSPVHVPISETKSTAPNQDTNATHAPLVCKDGMGELTETQESKQTPSRAASKQGRKSNPSGLSQQTTTFGLHREQYEANKKIVETALGMKKLPNKGKTAPKSPPAANAREPTKSPPRKQASPSDGSRTLARAMSNVSGRGSGDARLHHAGRSPFSTGRGGGSIQTQVIKPDKERARNVDTFVMNGSNDQVPLSEKMLKGFPQVHVSKFNCLDTTDGFCLQDEEEKLVAVKLPCANILSKYPCGLDAKKATKKQVELIEHLDKLVKAGKHTGRGKSRQVFTEDSTGPLKYLCLGCKAVQGGKGGVSFSQVSGFDFDEKGPFQTMVAVMQKQMANYIPTGELVGLKHAQEIVCPDGTIIGLMQDTHGLASSVNVAKNVVFGQHVDPDLYYSGLTVHIHPDQGKDQGIVHYQMDSPILAYFVFGGLGHAVAMRSGNVLIFNPTFVHSISSPCQPWEFYSSSLYTKTAVVAGNTNERELKIEGRAYVKDHNIV
jgi:hypothetical protein